MRSGPPHQRPSVSPRLAAFSLVVVAAVAVGPYWASGTSLLLSDLVLYFPSLYASLPSFWDPMVQGGTPLLPNPQAGWFYPPAWLLGPDLQRGLPLYVWLHLAVAGLAAWAWARSSLGDTPGALLVGLGWQLAGPTLSLSLTPDKLPGHAALPALLLGLHWMLGDPRPTRRAWGLILGVASVAASWLGGSVEALFVAGLAAPAWAALLPGGGRTPREALARMAAAVGVLALGTLVASCLLVPFFALLPHTARAGALPIGEALQRSTLPVDWLGWLSPNPFWAGEDLRYVIDDAGTTRSRWLRSLYGGSLVLPLAAAALLSRGRGVAPAVMGVLGFAFLALGEANPARELLHRLPGVGSMRYPDKWWLGTVPFQAWLLGAGLDAVLGDRRAARGFLIVALAALGCAGLGASLDGGGPVARALIAAASCLPVLAVAAAVGVNALRGGRVAVWLLPALVALDLLVAGAGSMPRADAGLARQVPPVVAAIHTDWAQRDADRLFGAPRLWDESQHHGHPLPVAAPGEPYRRLQRHLATPNLATEHGVAYVDGMRAIRMARQARFSGPLEHLEPEPRRALLRAVGADYWTTYSPEESALLAEQTGLRHVLDAGSVPLDVGLLAEPSPLPRARWVSQARLAPDDAAAYRFMQARPSTDVAALVLGDPGVASLQGTLGGGAPPTAEWRAAGPGRWEVAWEGEASGLWVIQDGWAPGWRGSLDGGPWTPVARVEHMLIGVPAPAGTHTLVIRYVPVGLGAGVALSLVGICIVGLGALRLRRGQRRRGGGQHEAGTVA